MLNNAFHKFLTYMNMGVNINNIAWKKYMVQSDSL